MLSIVFCRFASYHAQMNGKPFHQMAADYSMHPMDGYACLPLLLHSECGIFHLFASARSPDADLCFALEQFTPAHDACGGKPAENGGIIGNFASGHGARACIPL